jgi:hypothetical protein
LFVLSNLLPDKDSRIVEGKNNKTVASARQIAVVTIN